MNVSPRLVDFGFRVLNAVHRSVVRVTAGRLGRHAFGMEIIELITVGRRSGRLHSTMLTVPVIEGVMLVLVASKGGDDRDPDWLKNLMANPKIQVILRGERRDMVGRLASPEEYARLWPQVVATYKSYDAYRRRTARAIPLVLCTPIDE
jgi:deazaflavin-dependent oxidoreductase (nitroreductase family)